MRILIDARTLGSKPSGIGTYIDRFVSAMVTQDHVEMILATDVAESAEMRQWLERPQVRVCVYGRSVSKGPSVWKYAAYLKRLLRELKPDIFWEPNNLLPVRFKNPYGKYVVTIHDIFPVTMPECYGRIYPLYFKYGLNKTLRCCDAVLYDAETMKEEVERYFPQAAKREALVGYAVVPPIEQRKSFEREKYFFYIGNLEKRKGTDMLLTAYREYLNFGGERELYLAGKVREPDIQQQLNELSAQTDKLHYLGYIDDAEKSRRYWECGAFVFPSRAEGFGIPVIEALSCGTPVIVSDLPIFRELVGDAVCYFGLASDYQENVAHLTEAMHATAENSVSAAQRQATALRYEAANLMPVIMDFFEELIK